MDPFLSPKRIGFGSRFWTVGLHHTSHRKHHDYQRHQQHQEHQPLSDQAGQRGAAGSGVYAERVRSRDGGPVYSQYRHGGVARVHGGEASPDGAGVHVYGADGGRRVRQVMDEGQQRVVQPHHGGQPAEGCGGAQGERQPGYPDDVHVHRWQSCRPDPAGGVLSVPQQRGGRCGPSDYGGELLL